MCIVTRVCGLLLSVALAQAALGQNQTVKIFGLVELSGTGATSGTNFNDGVRLAVKEINAAGRGGGHPWPQRRIHRERHTVSTADCKGTRSESHR